MLILRKSCLKKLGKDHCICRCRRFHLLVSAPSQAGLVWFSRANCINNESISWDWPATTTGVGRMASTIRTVGNLLSVLAGNGAIAPLPSIGMRDLAAVGPWWETTIGSLGSTEHISLDAHRPPVATSAFSSRTGKYHVNQAGLTAILYQD